MFCETEDSQWCIWNAAQQGNGQGSSFISLWEGMTINMVTGITILALIVASGVLWFMHKKGVI